MTIEEMATRLKKDESIIFRREGDYIAVEFRLYKHKIFSSYNDLIYVEDLSKPHYWDFLLEGYSRCVHQNYLEQIRDIAEEYLKEVNNGDT